MIIAICILAGLLLCALFVIACLWHAINKLIDEYIEANPKEMMEFYWDKYAEEKFPCTLLLTENNNAEFDGSVYDFSQYEEKNIIGLIECKKGTTKHNDDEPQIALIPGQTVCKMKDGSFQWDFRGLI
jgi:hypothetical protein